MTRNLKVGVLGTRHVHAAGIARTLQEVGCTVVGAAEADAAAHDAWSEHDLAPLVEREELLADVDAVIVMGTNSERVDDTLAAVHAGKPTLTEKPVADNREDLARIDASVEAHRLVMMALPLRFARVMQQAKQMVESGGLGTPIAARGTNHGTYPGGWFGDRALAGGGAVMDHTIHIADGLSWLLGERIHDVNCAMASRIHNLEVDDCGVLTFGFDSGCIASLDASWSRPSSFHTWGDVWIELIGTEGRLLIDPLATKVKLYDNSAGKLRTLDYGDDMTRTMCQAFVEFAMNGGDSPVPLADGVHGTAVTLAAYESAATAMEPALVLGA